MIFYLSVDLLKKTAVEFNFRLINDDRFFCKMYLLKKNCHFYYFVIFPRLHQSFISS